MAPEAATDVPVKCLLTCTYGALLQVQPSWPLIAGAFGAELT